MNEQISIQEQAYLEGFAAKCAEYGVDPAAVMKLAAKPINHGKAPGSEERLKAYGTAKANLANSRTLAGDAAGSQLDAQRAKGPAASTYLASASANAVDMAKRVQTDAAEVKRLRNVSNPTVKPTVK